jgi:hypothetical protein
MANYDIEEPTSNIISHDGEGALPVPSKGQGGNVRWQKAFAKVGSIFSPSLERVWDPITDGMFTGGKSSVWVGPDANLTRPGNATAYVAHQAMGSGSSVVFTYTNFFPKVGVTGLLTGIRLLASGSTIAVTNMGAVRAHLYNAAPTSPPSADQQTFVGLFSNSSKGQGFADFSTWNIGGTGSDVISAYGSLPQSGPLPIQADATTRDLKIILEASGAFTPLSGMVLRPLYISNGL